jgi:prostaglandin-H2 D-isomerase / glutathione transferase
MATDPKIKLTYFDQAASRGEECRIALYLAGVDFEDRRIRREEWTALKPETPFGALPLLEVPGKPVLAQSNAILVYLGRRFDLHPKDDFEAALHEAMMCHVEDARGQVANTLHLPADEKKRVRERLASEGLPAWGARAERQIRDAGPFFGGKQIQVVDLKIYMLVRWFASGILDHIPGSVVADFPTLNRIHDAVRDHEGVKRWNASVRR